MLSCIQIQAQIQGWSRSYEVSPAQEYTWGHFIKNDTIILNSFNFCYEDYNECTYLSKIDTAGNLCSSFEIHKEGKSGQFSLQTDFIDLDSMFAMTGDDAWDNDTSYQETQYLYLINYDMSNYRRYKLPVSESDFQYGRNLIYYKEDSLFVLMGNKLIENKPINKKRITLTGMSLSGEVKWQYTYTDPKKYFINYFGGIIKNSDTSFIVSIRVGAWRVQYFSINIKGKLLWEYTEDNGPIDDLNDPSTFTPYIADVNGKDLIRVWYYDAPNYHNLAPEISRLDYKGNKKWTTPLREDYGGPGFFPWTKATVIQGLKIQQIVKAQNGDILGVGSCVLSENYWTTGKPNYAIGYAFRIDTAGKMKWERLFLDSDKYKYGYQELNNIAEADDGAIYLSGTLRDSLPKGIPGTGNNNIWLIKVGPDGCITPGCTDTLLQVATTKILNQRPELLSVYPNPGSTELNISWKNTPSDPLLLEIRSISGQLIQSEKIQADGGTSTHNVSNIPSGLYLLTLRGRDWQSMPVKWVKM